MAPVITRNSMGEAVEGFAIAYQNVPAAAKPFTGREKFHVESGREIAYKQIKFTIRYISGLNEKHRIVYEGENFDILWIEEVALREGINILAELAR